MNYDFSTIFALKDTVKEIIDNSTSGDVVGPKNFALALSQKTLLSNAHQEDDRFRVLENDDAVAEYARWALLGETIDISSLRDLHENIEKCFSKATTPIITRETVNQVRAALDREFDFTERFLSKYPISVSIIDAEHTECNGFVTAVWNDPRTEGATFLFRVHHADPNFARTPAAILLHEIGHHVHLCAYGSELDVPKTFYRVMAAHGINVSAMTKHEMRELFADVFSIAMTAHTTEFGEIYPGITPAFKEHCFDYMTVVINGIYDEDKSI